MNDEMIKVVASQGVWAMLSFTLIFYILKTQEKRDEKQEVREQKYQEIISELTNKFEDINNTVNDIKKMIKESK